MLPLEPRAAARLVKAVQNLSLARSLDAVQAIVRTAARELTGADGATFVLRDDDRCFYADEDAIAPLWKGQRFPMSTCISGWAMLNRSPAVIEDIYADARIPADAYQPTFVKSLAMVPIRTAEPIGAIGNYWASSHLATDAEVAVLQALADSVSVAMENLRLYDALEARVRERTEALEAARHAEAAARRELDERMRAEASLRRMEEQLRQSQKMEAVGLLAGGVAHDFNNILSVILSYGALLLEDLKPTDPIRADIEEIHKAGQRAATMTRQLLAFGRRQALELGSLDVNEVVAGIDAMVRRLIGADIELEVRATQGADADHLTIRDRRRNSGRTGGAAGAGRGRYGESEAT
jgi:signal transduction histidine kinase